MADLCKTRAMCQVVPGQQVRRRLIWNSLAQAMYSEVELTVEGGFVSFVDASGMLCFSHNSSLSAFVVCSS